MEISVIVPVYNKEKYIHTILRQLVDQSFDSYECLLINDGSTDNSGLICDEFAKQDKRFKVIHTANGGVSNARNIGLDKAIGKYITFVDADDEIHNNFLLNLYNCIERNNVDLVVSSYKKFWDYKNEINVVNYPIVNKVLKFANVLETFAYIQKNTGIFGCCCSKIFKKSLIENIRFDNKLRLAEDFDFYLKLYNKIESIYFDDKPYYYYRQEAENSSCLVNDYNIDYLSQLKLNLRYKQFLINNNSYNLDNKIIVDELINNYFYFSLFYSSIDELNNRIDTLLRIKKTEELNVCGVNLKQKIFIKLLNKNNKLLIRIILLIYRKLRKV